MGIELSEHLDICTPSPSPMTVLTHPDHDTNTMMTTHPLPHPHPSCDNKAVLQVTGTMTAMMCDATPPIPSHLPTNTNVNADNAFAFVFVCEWSWSPTSLILGWYGQYPRVWKSIPTFRPIPVTTSIDPSWIRYRYER